MLLHTWSEAAVIAWQMISEICAWLSISVLNALSSTSHHLEAVANAPTLVINPTALFETHSCIFVVGGILKVMSPNFGACQKRLVMFSSGYSQ